MVIKKHTLYHCIGPETHMIKPHINLFVKPRDPMLYSIGDLFLTYLYSPG